MAWWIFTPPPAIFRTQGPYGRFLFDEGRRNTYTHTSLAFDSRATTGAHRAPDRMRYVGGRNKGS